MEPLEKLFVYGLLSPGQRLHGAIQPHVHRLRFGVIRGVLVDLGFCPALMPGDGLVLGMLLDVDPKALEVADRIEGCRSDRSDSFYFRRKVLVRLADRSEVEAWVYELACPANAADCPELIVETIDGRSLYAWS